MAKKIPFKDWKHTPMGKNASPSTTNNGVFPRDSLHGGSQDEEDNSMDSQNLQLKEIFNQTMRDLEFFHFHPPVDKTIYQKRSGNMQDLQKMPNIQHNRPETELHSHEIEENSVHTKSQLLLPPISDENMLMIKASYQRRKQRAGYGPQMTAASMSSASSTGNRSKTNRSSPAPPSNIQSFSSCQYVQQDEASLPRINPSRQITKNGKSTSSKEYLNLPKIKKCHKDYFCPSSRSPDDIFHSVDKWLRECSFGSQNPTKQQMIVRPLEKIISMPHLQSSSKIMKPEEDLFSQDSTSKPKVRWLKSHSTMWILKESLKKLDNDAKKLTPKPLTHSDVTRLLTDKTAEKIRKITTYGKKQTRDTTSVKIHTNRDEANERGKSCAERHGRRTASKFKRDGQDDDKTTSSAVVSSNKSNRRGESIIKPLSLSPLTRAVNKSTPQSSAIGESSKSCEKQASGSRGLPKLSSHKHNSSQKDDTSQEQLGLVPPHLQVPLWWVEM